MFEQRHLSTAVYFGPNPPFAWDRERELEPPFAARYVTAPPAFGQTRLTHTPPDSLFQEAEELMRSISDDLAEARQALTQLKVLNPKLPPRRPGTVRHCSFR